MAYRCNFGGFYSILWKWQHFALGIKDSSSSLKLKAIWFTAKTLMVRWMTMRHIFDQWRLTIDDSKTNLKAVLLLIENKFSSPLVLYATSTKEKYPIIKNFPVGVEYKKYQCEVCHNLEVITILLGLLTICINDCCLPLLCEWNICRRLPLH